MRVFRTRALTARGGLKIEDVDVGLLDCDSIWFCWKVQSPS
jgi:hypothetical protein